MTENVPRLTFVSCSISNCYYLKEMNKSDYNKVSMIWRWQLYQLLRDDNCNDDEEIHNFTCTVIDDGSAETPLVIQILHEYSSMPL